MKTSSIALLILLLCGCATCREHPAVCIVAGAVIAGSIVAAQHDGRARAPTRSTIGTPGCAADPALCQ